MTESTMTKVNRVFLVGHCGADGYGLKSLVSHVAKKNNLKVKIIMADAQSDLETVEGHTDLLLINRILGGFFETESGIELIGNLSQATNAPKMILISNYEDSQREAVSVGAFPGFGKASLATQQTFDRLSGLMTGTQNA